MDDVTTERLTETDLLFEALRNALLRKAATADTAEDIEALAAIAHAVGPYQGARVDSVMHQAVTRFAEKADTLEDMKALEHVMSRYPLW